MSGSVSATVVYQATTNAVKPGQAVTLKSIHMNTSDSDEVLAEPEQLMITWCDERGKTFTTTARPSGRNQSNVTVPSKGFVELMWVTDVPDQVKGLVTLQVEGNQTLLAFDMAGSERHRQKEHNFSFNQPLWALDAGSKSPESGMMASSTGAIKSKKVSYSGQMLGTHEEEHEMGATNRFTDSISPYEPVYFSFGSRGGNTARFQLSLKYRIFKTEYEEARPFNENVLGALADRLYFGYTQTSVWDLYQDSKPFRDTSYKPSFFLYDPNYWQSANQKWQLGYNLGYQHESNGKDDEDSRSIDIAYVRPILSYQADNGDVFSFAPRFYGYLDKDENRDISDYRGYVDWQARWKMNNGTVLSAHLRQGKEGGSQQLDLAYPLRKLMNLNGYLHLQYFGGYGETLLEYDVRRRSQVRIGLMIIP